MARISDYTIIDHGNIYGKVGGNSTEITTNFELPNTLDKESRSILAWMMNVPEGGVNVTVNVNGNRIYNGHHGDAYYGPTFSVVKSNALNKGANTVNFIFDVGGTEDLYVNNVVLWWQANI